MFGDTLLFTILIRVGMEVFLCWTLRRVGGTYQSAFTVKGCGGTCKATIMPPGREGKEEGGRRGGIQWLGVMNCLYSRGPSVPGSS